jgi:putative hemolysin
MNWAYDLGFIDLLSLLALAAYIDRIYFEMGKFLSREYTENIEAWEKGVEPKLRLNRDSAALSASVLRQLALGGLAFLLAIRLRDVARDARHISVALFEFFLVLVFFDRLLPELFFTRTRGQWVVRMQLLVQALFYLVLPVTLTISLLLSIAGLAEPEAAEDEHPSEGVDALLEAGEEEGILEESDRELVRNVVEFGDKVVRTVMTPRPDMFAVPGTMSLEEFTTAVNEHGFSRVPVYAASLDEITGVAFSRDLLAVRDSEAGHRTVSEIQRPAAFIPESKNVSELLREMQSQQQHLSIVIDEYGGVAGLVTIEDLLEAIVGNIEDEHDEPIEDAPVPEGEGVFLLPGGFEVSRLRDLFGESTLPALQHERGEGDEAPAEPEEATPDNNLPQLLTGYEATTVGGLVSEIAGHIPLPGEVVEDGPLRLEVIASTDRLVERVRVSLAGSANTSEPE